MIVCTADSLLAALASTCADERRDLAETACEEAMWENELARKVFTEPGHFMILYERYYERIFRYLCRRTRNEDEARDLTSQAFLQAFESLRSREQRIAFRPWLYRIATNLHTSEIRRLCRWAARAGDVAANRLLAIVRTPRDRCEEHERAQQVRAALDHLPDAYRTALLLRYDEELSTEEIAEVLVLTPGGVRTRIARGLAMIEQALASLQGESEALHEQD